MITELNTELFNEMLDKAKSNTRKRSHFNLHKTLDDPVQRLCIALLKDTYIKPHYHYKAELIIPLKGSLELIIFDNDGTVLEKKTITPSSNSMGVEIDSEVIHTFYPSDPEVFAIEIKKGPFEPNLPEHFAVWAPNEGEDTVRSFQKWMTNSKIGEKFTI